MVDVPDMRLRAGKYEQGAGRSLTVKALYALPMTVAKSATRSRRTVCTGWSVPVQHRCLSSCGEQRTSCPPLPLVEMNCLTDRRAMPAGRPTLSISGPIFFDTPLSSKCSDRRDVRTTVVVASAQGSWRSCAWPLQPLGMFELVADHDLAAGMPLMGADRMSRAAPVNGRHIAWSSAASRPQNKLPL
jgi:hypothetical protein